MWSDLLDELHSLGVEGELVAVVLALMVGLGALYVVILVLRFVLSQRSRRAAPMEVDTILPAAKLDPIADLAQAILGMTNAFNEANKQSQAIVKGFADMAAHFGEMLILNRQLVEQQTEAFGIMENVRRAREKRIDELQININTVPERIGRELKVLFDQQLAVISAIKEDVTQIDKRISSLPDSLGMKLIQGEIQAVQGDISALHKRVDILLTTVQAMESRAVEPSELAENHPEVEEVKPVEPAVPPTPETTADASAASASEESA